MKFLPAIILCILLGLLATSNSGFASSVSPPSTVPSKPSQLPPASLASCVALASPSGTIVHVSTVAQLQQAVASLQSNTTIMIADGDYPLDNTLVINGGVQNVALRGASGNRDAVVLRGHGMTNPNYGNVPPGVLVQTSSNILIANLTIRDVYYHGVQIQGEQNAQSPHLYNLHLIDTGEQFVKVSTAPGGPYADNGEVACSVIEYTDRAPSDYTNGVDALAVSGWVIRDNPSVTYAPPGSAGGTCRADVAQLAQQPRGAQPVHRLRPGGGARPQHTRWQLAGWRDHVRPPGRYRPEQLHISPGRGRHR